MEPICYKCLKPLGLKAGAKVSYTETCGSCDADVRACKSCLHYNLNAYNGCNESQAERVVDKERRNYCDYFKLAGKGEAKNISKDATFSKLDDLFKK
jgi:hypothetical protein